MSSGQLRVAETEKSALLTRTLLWISCSPTSRLRTSRQVKPKSRIRCRASSRRFPFSTPDDTNGIGMSLEVARGQQSTSPPIANPSTPLHSIDASPRRDEGEDASDNVHESVRRVVLVPSCPPQLVQARTSNHECRVDLETVGAEGRVLKVLVELLHVTLDAHIGQIRLRNCPKVSTVVRRLIRKTNHHVRNDLEAGVLGHVEALAGRLHGVTTICVSRNILVD